jgi:hypothetical protein
LEKDSVNVTEVLTKFKEYICQLMKEAPCVSTVAFEMIIEIAQCELGENMLQDLLEFLSSNLKLLRHENLNVVEPFARLIRVCAGDGLKDWLSGRFSIREMGRRVSKVGEENMDPLDYTSNCGKLIITVLFYSEFLDLTTSDEREEFAQYLNMVFFKDFEGVLNTPLPTELINALIHVLGNMCIRRGKNAEDLVRIFIYSLSDGSNSASTRIIALSVVADLCVVKTHLVDRFMDILAALLEDKDETVQIATMQHLTNLLKKDFIRMVGFNNSNGNLFFILETFYSHADADSRCRSGSSLPDCSSESVILPASSFEAAKSKNLPGELYRRSHSRNRSIFH